MTTPLLPQQIAPVDDRQSELTRRYLTGDHKALFGYFMALRAETDRHLASALPAVGGKPYPYGRCEEITRDLFARLAQRLQRPDCAVEQGLRAFADAGGILRSVWGVLRDQYFQNALQLGGLYVDVSNDTVVVTKPKIEILPIDACGLVPVRDLDHFRRTAQAYWGAELYANHLVPTLAPLLPILSVSPGKLAPGLQSACDYMIALMRLDRFRQAEAWLAEGPPPPEALTASFLAGVPADLHPLTGQRREEALLVCRRAQAAGCWGDDGWRNARVLDYLRLLREAGHR
ncbi:hypothetical protein [Azospirillum picis]|uniref:Uncharacterized protein n=1 Tax=Azospirillum picis TaxID=488438 RepID=A0ABU0MGH1_9PROT|nr:hypothetical protein [Azospirillum picis]MBP2298409.1 hypothetical protein [Azospirillum picis]MDQ0532542.1 hypothetical protein [Azospirillum picis]